MPFLDGTGPRGQGPMTGWGMGYCSGSITPGSPPMAGRGRAGWGMGRGMGFGRGWGRGMGFGPGRGWGPRYMGWGAPYYGGMTFPGAVPYAPQMSREQEVDFLKEEANAVKAQLEEIEARINDLESVQE